MVPPWGYYWSKIHSWADNKRSLQEYRVLLDSLQDSDVEWMPYTQEVMNELPPSCRLNERYWLSTTALLDFPIVETYHPDRVMRQFGKYQVVPPPNRSTNRDLHFIDRQRFPKTDWRAEHHTFYDEWSLNREDTIIREDRPYDPNSLEWYLEWYNSATIPTFRGAGGYCADGGPARERLLRPNISFKKLVTDAIKFAKKAVKKMRGKGDQKFANEAFRLCRNVVGTVGDIATFDRALENVSVNEEQGEELESEEEEAIEEEEVTEEEEATEEEDDVSREEDDEMNQPLSQL